MEWRSKIIIIENELTSGFLNEHFSRVLEGERTANDWEYLKNLLSSNFPSLN